MEDFVTGFANLKNDACLQFEISWASNIEAEKNYYQILGDKGGITYEKEEKKDSMLIFIKRDEDQFVNIEPKLKTDGYTVTEFGHFVDSILEDRIPFISPPEQAVDIMKLIDAAYQSAAQSGRQVIFD